MHNQKNTLQGKSLMDLSSSLTIKEVKVILMGFFP